MNKELGPLIRVLNALGLHVVTDADKRVLDASSKFPLETLLGDPTKNLKQLKDASWEWTQAEIARRELSAAKP